MLPVSQATFKTAVTSLGKGLIHVRESLSKEILSLLHMQTDLQSKQDETHEQVLYVQDQVSDVHDDLHGLQGSMDDCQRALRSTDQRTTYIAKGIRLVTQGMTAMLPPDDELRREIDRFARSDVQGHTSSGSTENNTGATTTGRNDRPVRNKPEVLDKTTTQQQDGEPTRSRSSSSRASRESRRAERRQANGSFRKANNNNNYQPDSPSDCHTSVSSGTPLRHIVIPSRRSKGSSAAVVSSPAVQELDEVRALLASMEQAQATVM
jgi:chromosome segregation ATPase